MIHAVISSQDSAVQIFSLKVLFLYLLSMLEEDFLKYTAIYKGSTKIAQDLSVSAKAAFQERW